MFKPYASLLEGKIAHEARQAVLLDNPIAVGAVGGSGTRILAQILAEAGVAMATPSNDAHDALEWPPMHPIIHTDKLQSMPLETRLRAAFWGLEFLLLKRREQLGLSGRTGWKVPATHLWLRELADYFPAIQYIHIIRNGLDMAYSGNQRQLSMWGEYVGLHTQFDDTGRAAAGDAMEYWLIANEKAMEVGAPLEGQFLLVRYEALCQAPDSELERIFSFLELDIDVAERAALADRIRPPATLNRFRHHKWRDDFTQVQLQRLEALGYRP